ncbi:MAG: hypothetical protein Q9162_003840 [Coniocarpon cinnabarinum]
MPLAHLRLPGLTKYVHAASLQEKLVKRLLAHKANPSIVFAPQPTVITAEFTPVYTTGRRDIGNVSASQEAHLRANGAAEFRSALRGGQTTYHGPGQLVAYPVLDLKRHQLSARCYVDLLEEAVIRTCARYDVHSFRTENPGVWTDADHKICALGVHLRRNVTSHGIGLNICTDMKWFERIVACGLEGKHSTSLHELGQRSTTVNEVAYGFVDELRRLLMIDEAITVTEADILGDHIAGSHLDSE